MEDNKKQVENNMSKILKQMENRLDAQLNIYADNKEWNTTSEVVLNLAIAYEILKEAL